MSILRIRKVSTTQPQKFSGINPTFPMPTEVFLPHLTRNGLLRNSVASGGVGSTAPTTSGVGFVFTSEAQYTFPLWDGESKVAWFCLAYRDNSSPNTYSLVRKAGTLIPIQEALGGVRCVPWPDRTDPMYTSNIADCYNRVNAFGGRIDGSNNVIHFNGTRVTFSESIPLSSGATNLCIGGNESGGEIATPWKILAVVLWQKNIPTENQLMELQKNPWLVFAPSVSYFPLATSSLNNRFLTASGGSYALTGNSAQISRNRKLTSSGGTYSYTGQSVTITWTGTSTAYTLTALGGSYALSGAPAVVKRSKYLSGLGGSYNITGASSNILKSKYITTSGGIYSFTGTSSTILRNKNISATSGVYTYTGATANIKKSKYLSASGGVYSLVGSNVILVHGGIGGIVWPPEYLVVLGTTYGPTGSEYVGTLDVNGIKYDITTGQLVKPINDKVVMSL